VSPVVPPSSSSQVPTSPASSTASPPSSDAISSEQATPTSDAPPGVKSETSEAVTSETLPTSQPTTVAASSDSEDSSSPGVSPPAFLLGADISSIPEALDAGGTFVDTDGQTKPLLALLANHGFNAIRLRTFVDPDAPYGYARGTGGSCLKSEPYNDTTHTVEFGAAVKAAGMQLLVDFHYSDTWADPGKQIIPDAWRDVTSIDDLASRVGQYTTSVLEALIAAGAKPDMVQVGNETTPGMLIHVPGNDTDCWGNNSTVNAGLNGQASNGNWDNLAKLFKAGADAVHAVDPNIKVVLHIENTDDLDGVRWWVDSAVSRDIDFDVLGLSAYTAFQGQPEVWENTLETMAEEFPELEFIIAEYNPERTRANQIVHDLPNARGIGTFFWEPTLSGTWGESMFTQSGNKYTARAEDFAEYDALRAELGL
jgi:arabinogalactan endo-1,4-beta-galactosidase